MNIAVLLKLNIKKLLEIEFFATRWEFEIM